MASNNSERIRLSRESLKVGRTGARRSPLAPVIFCGIAVFFLYFWLKDPDSGGWLLLCSLFSAAVGAFGIFIVVRDGVKAGSRADAIRRGEMFFVQNQVTDRESRDSSSGDSPAPSPTYILYFQKPVGEKRRAMEVSKEEYLSTSEGKKYYLLYVGQELVHAYPCDRYFLDAELEKLLVKDPAVVGVTRLSEYEQYQKLERQVGVLARERWLKTHKSIPEPDRN